MAVNYDADILAMIWPVHIDSSTLTLVEYRSLVEPKRKTASRHISNSDDLLRSPAVQRQLAAVERLRLSHPFS
jgi:hypothetical protein